MVLAILVALAGVGWFISSTWGTARTPLASPTPSLPDGFELHHDPSGLSIATPASWTYASDPVPNLTDPRIRLAVGSWSFPTGGVCGPDPALAALPPDGVFIWITETPSSEIAPQMVSTFGPRPTSFSFDAPPTSQPDCATARPSYTFWFKSGGRFLTVGVAFGDSSSDAAKRTADQVLQSISVPTAVSYPTTLAFAHAIRAAGIGCVRTGIPFGGLLQGNPLTCEVRRGSVTIYVDDGTFPSWWATVPRYWGGVSWVRGPNWLAATDSRAAAVAIHDALGGELLGGTGSRGTIIFPNGRTSPAP